MIRRPLVRPSTRAATLEGVAWALLAILLWSGWFVVTRVAVGSAGSLRPSDLVAIRFGIGGLLALPVLLRRARDLPRQAWIDGLWLTIGSGAPFALVISIGLQFAPAGHAAALAPGTMPLVAAVIGIIFLGDRPGPVSIAGLALITAGALSLSGGLGQREMLVGHALFLLGSVLWAAATVRLRRAGLSAVDATALICVYSLVGYIPLYLAFADTGIPAASWRELLVQGIYQGVLVSVVALAAFTRAIALLGRRAPAFTALVPVLATVIAIPVLGEVPTLADALGTATVALGVLLTALGPSRRPSTAP